MTDTNTPLVRRVAQWAAILSGTFFCVSFAIGSVVAMIFDPVLTRVVIEQFPITFGLPAAALLAIALVISLESTSGPIEFSGLGFTFKGASGPIVLWCVCFLCIVGAIKLLLR